MNGGDLSFYDGLDLFELYRLLLNAGADEILIDNVDVFWNYNGPVNDLKYLQQQAYPPYHSTPLRLRLDIAAAKLKFSFHNAPAVLETSLDSKGEINAEITEWTNEKEQTLLHLVLSAFAYDQFESCGPDGTSSDMYLDGSLETQDLETGDDNLKVKSLLYRHFVRKLVSAGASLQSVDSDGHTLLTGMIYSFLEDLTTALPWNWNTGRTLKTLNETLGGWLFCLLECGVDLQAYGAWETISSQNKDFRHCWCYSRLGDTDDEDNFPAFPLDYSAIFDIRLISISYGSRPEDWIFWFSEPSDPFAGDFWAMIEGEEHWRMFEKGWFFNTKYYKWEPRGWYFDEEKKDPDEEGASIDDLPMPGSWNEEL
jgi:hypothetical protein